MKKSNVILLAVAAFVAVAWSGGVEANPGLFRKKKNSVRSRIVKLDRYFNKDGELNEGYKVTFLKWAKKNIK